MELSTTWVADHLNDVDNTPSLMFIDYIGRNWGLAELSPAAHQLALQVPPEGLSQLIWRLILPDFPPTDQLLDNPKDTQELMAAALFCDQRPVGDGFGAAVDAFIAEGGYLASHAGIALKWVREHGCQLGQLDARVDLVESRLAAELEGAQVADDMHLELGAVLVYLGAADRVPQSFVDLAVEQQHSDGGWGINGPENPSNWHPTFLGLWMLLGVVEGPGNRATMMSVAKGQAS